MDNLELRAQLERHHRASYGWALSCCARDPAEAEDVLQTVYLKVLEGQARYHGQATFKTWLFSVIRKTAASARRRNRLQWIKRIKGGESAGPTTPEASLDETLYRSQIQTPLRQALVALPKRQQEVLQLVFYHDLSLSEAAEVMGVSLGSARVHYERGKKRLRQWLEESKVFHEYGLGRKRNQGTIP